MIPASLLGNDLCLSGGADGADFAWGEAAAAAGHKVIHWSFDKHKSKCPPDTVVRLTPEHLDEADKALRRANRTLKRRYPVRNPHTANLLKRNFYQVRWSDAVYAVATLEDGLVSGGTAWAVQMYLDFWLHDNRNLDLCRCYLFDLAEGRWLEWRTAWLPIDRPPRPSGVYAAVGSRALGEAGARAITDVYN